MKIGDLIEVKGCGSDPWADWSCGCFFCNGNSNRIGLVTGPAPRNSWLVMFDCGEWRLDDFEEARGEVKVISEGR
jgi:hypothetical protein